ncbi:hypothetical protein, partial [Escherichia coli]|uniref:hypothetical protein n=1 Tax=Escherichia coli TaxID=562 RepID=UPI0030799512
IFRHGVVSNDTLFRSDLVILRTVGCLAYLTVQQVSLPRLESGIISRLNSNKPYHHGFSRE